MAEEESETGPVDTALSMVRELRESVDIFTPTIFWQPASTVMAVADIPSPTDDFSQNLNIAFEGLRKYVGVPVWFAVVLDAYARDGESPEEEKPAPGELEAAFNNGAPDVVEQMVSIFFTPEDRDLVMIRQIYRHTPVDGWEWNAPEVVSTPDDAVCQAVQQFG